GQSTILSGARFNLEPGDRIGILGRNGAGKSTLIKTIAGQLAPLRGKLQRDERLNVGYFHQHQVDALQADKSAMAHLVALAPEEREQVLRDYLGRFDFRGDRVFEAVGGFSGGEKARLALALLVWQKPNLLLLDEPTNHLDLEMRHALEVALLEFAGAAILVAHDRHLLSSCSDRFWLVADGALRDFDGDLDDYAAWLAKSQSPVPAPGEATQPNVSAVDRRRAAAQQREKEKPLRAALKKAEQEMDRLQQALQSISTQLADPALYSSQPEKARELVQEEGRCRKALESAEQAWLEAAEALESGA
ncbi:MAG: ATP-binding cassette domain-containing protein, partial [Oceanococcaceae bacterium]